MLRDLKNCLNTTLRQADAAYRLAAQKHHGDFAAIKTLEAAKWS